MNILLLIGALSLSLNSFAGEKIKVADVLETSNDEVKSVELMILDEKPLSDADLEDIQKNWVRKGVKAFCFDGRIAVKITHGERPYFVGLAKRNDDSSPIDFYDLIVHHEPYSRTDHNTQGEVIIELYSNQLQENCFTDSDSKVVVIGNKSLHLTVDSVSKVSKHGKHLIGERR